MSIVNCQWSIVVIITWYGQFCFRIQAGELNLLIDPLGKESGLKTPRDGTNILLLSHSHSYPDLAKFNQAFLIECPGEYELKNTFIQGRALEDHIQKNQITIYVIEIEGMRIVHLGALKKSNLSEKELEMMGEVDILMLPVGGKSSIDGERAAKILSQIEPKIVLPMNYKVPGINLNLERVERFLKAMGQEKVEALLKLVIKKKDLPQEGMKVVVLKPV